MNLEKLKAEYEQAPNLQHELGQAAVIVAEKEALREAVDRKIEETVAAQAENITFADFLFSQLDDGRLTGANPRFPKLICVGETDGAAFFVGVSNSDSGYVYDLYAGISVDNQLDTRHVSSPLIKHVGNTLEGAAVVGRLMGSEDTVVQNIYDRQINSHGDLNQRNIAAEARLAELASTKAMIENALSNAPENSALGRMHASMQAAGTK